MTAIVDIFPLSKNYNFYIQDAGMTTEKREEFLAHFEKIRQRQILDLSFLEESFLRELT